MAQDYKKINGEKKRQQIAFRRWMKGIAPADQMRQYWKLNFLEMREWISRQFVDGMTWENYGSHWVIDHVVPLRMFDLSKEKEIRLAWHYQNLMPLFKHDNLNKEGDLRFSIMILENREHCFITQSLLNICINEIAKLEKYIERQKCQFSNS